MVETVRVDKTLDARAFFNPIDCRSLDVIREELKTMEAGQILEIYANLFQKREIEAWAKKFQHPILSATHHEGLVTLHLQKGPPLA